MAITVRRRSRSRREATPTGPVDETIQAERAAMAALAETLRRLAAELPPESRLAVEFTTVARGIDVAGVLGTWRLDALAREPTAPMSATPGDGPAHPGVPAA